MVHLSSKLPASSTAGDGDCTQLPQQEELSAKLGQAQWQMQQYMLQQQQQHQKQQQQMSQKAHHSHVMAVPPIQGVPISVTTASHPAPSAGGPSAGSKRPREEQTVARQPPLLSKLSKRPSIIGPASVAAAIAGATAPNNAGGLPPTHPNPAGDDLRQHMTDQLASSYSAACSASIRAQFTGASSSLSSSQDVADPNSAIPRATSTHSLPETSSSSVCTSRSASTCANATVVAGATALPSESSSVLPAGSVAHRSVDTAKQAQEQQKRSQAAGSNRREAMTRVLSCPTVVNGMNPQTYLDSIIKTRGYDTNNYCSLESGYYCKPTAHQKASYGIKIVNAVRTGDAKFLASLLRAGLSRNPCNAFGESIVHMVCRRGEMDLLQVLKEAGTSLQVSDDFGRTPLHDACWTATPNFDVVDLILRSDSRLLRICDCRGASPLSYVKRDNWSVWVDYLNSRKDEFWPPRDVGADGLEGPPVLVSEAPHTQPIPDPEDAASLDMAAMVASGRLGPEEARLEREQSKKQHQQSSSSSSPSPAPDGALQQTPVEAACTGAGKE